MGETPRGVAMSEFVYLYRSTNEASRAAMGSPEQMQKSMQTWMAWMKQLADKGHIKNPGHPLERAGKLVKGKQRTITDGPYAESDRKSTRLNSSHVEISYAVFCLKK